MEQYLADGFASLERKMGARRLREPKSSGVERDFQIAPPMVVEEAVRRLLDLVGIGHVVRQVRPCHEDRSVLGEIFHRADAIGDPRCSAVQGARAATPQALHATAVGLLTDGVVGDIDAFAIGPVPDALHEIFLLVEE